MHARADHDVVPLVQEDRDVVRVDPVDREREDARALAGIRRTQEMDPRLLGERGGDPSIDRVLLGLNLFEPDTRKVLEARVRADHSGVVLEAGFEPIGGRPEGVALERGPFHGFAAEEKGS